jgi:hypothetical protein
MAIRHRLRRDLSRQEANPRAQAAVRGVCAACEGRESIWAMERVKGIEPSYEAWEAAVLPLNYTRIWQLVDVQRVIGLSPRFYR